MKPKILYIFTRTPLHVGAGSSVGAIDMPVQRERHTGFPIIPGSSLKGVLRDQCQRDTDCSSRVSDIFGEQDKAGTVSVGEGRILAFPVRSAKGAVAFVTCPLALDRFQRDALIEDAEEVETPADMSCLAGAKVKFGRDAEPAVILEEYKFRFVQPFPEKWETALLDLLPGDPVWRESKGRFVLLSDGDFAHFVANACEVNQHIGIEPETGVVKIGALFNLEAVPSETLFYAVITALSRESNELDVLNSLIDKSPVLQFGGDSTTGLGFCSLQLS